MNNRSVKGNMISGNPAKELIIFAIPMILGNLFQQFYNIADSVIVGKFLGPDALAAVGASNSITTLFVMVAIGTGIGCSVIISQLFGAGRMKDVKSSISTALIAIFVFSIILSTIGFMLSGNILKWMHTPSDVYEEADKYLKIYFLGFAFLFMYNAFNAVFNALGDSAKPLVFLIFSSALNIGLDILFVWKFGWGVAGAAWATLIAQAVSAIISFIVLIHKIRGMQCERYDRFSPGLLKKMVSMAIPTVIQQSIVSIGLLLIQSVVNRFGSDFLAGYTAAIKIDNLVIVPMVNVGNAVSTFTAQNIGAGQFDRVKKGYRTGLIMAAAIGVALGVWLHFGSESVIGLFMDADDGAAAIRVGKEYLSIISLQYFMMGMMNVTAAILRGAGDKKWFLAQSLINLAFRVALVYILADITKGYVIMWASGIGWTIGFMISYFRYRQGGWRRCI